MAVEGKRGGVENYRRHLADKFTAEFDVWMARANALNDYGSRDFKRNLAKALKALAALGIGVDASQLPARLRVKEF